MASIATLNNQRIYYPSWTLPWILRFVRGAVHPETPGLIDTSVFWSRCDVAEEWPIKWLKFIENVM